MLCKPLSECVVFLFPSNAATFWMSTGMFPQEVIVRLAESTGIDTLTIDSYNGTPGDYRNFFLCDL